MQEYGKRNMHALSMRKDPRVQRLGFLVFLSHQKPSSSNLMSILFSLPRLERMLYGVKPGLPILRSDLKSTFVLGLGSTVCALRTVRYMAPCRSRALGQMSLSGRIIFRNHSPKIPREIWRSPSIASAFKLTSASRSGVDISDELK
jgi:hypothetical protein